MYKAPLHYHYTVFQQVEEYYFHHYAVHFGHAEFGEANRSIPYAMTWDDVSLVCVCLCVLCRCVCVKCVPVHSLGGGPFLTP